MGESEVTSAFIRLDSQDVMILAIARGGVGKEAVVVVQRIVSHRHRLTDLCGLRRREWLLGRWFESDGKTMSIPPSRR